MTIHKSIRWARAEGLRPDDPTEGIRPPRREPYARARGLSAEEVARPLAAIRQELSRLSVHEDERAQWNRDATAAGESLRREGDGADDERTRP